MNGETSSDADVESGIPEGTVLGLFFFLCHINDLPDRVKSTVYMFADECLIYRKIKSRANQIQLQHNLLASQEWADSWGMRFNAKKCYIPRICRPRVPKQFTYQLMGQALSQVDKNPYLGVMWQQDLSWLTHINNICGKANNTSAFLRRNLKYCPRQLISTAYTRPGFNSGIDLELDPIPCLIPGIGMGMGINF